MTILMERMREELVRRNYATTTIHSYLKAVEHFRNHVDTPIDAVGPDDLRSYHAYLLGTRKLAVNTVVGSNPAKADKRRSPGPKAGGADRPIRAAEVSTRHHLRSR